MQFCEVGIIILILKFRKLSHKEFSFLYKLWSSVKATRLHVTQGVYTVKPMFLTSVPSRTSLYMYQATYQAEEAATSFLCPEVSV